MLQAKLHSQEEDFRLQNSTLMAEFSKLCSQMEHLELENQQLKDEASKTGAAQAGSVVDGELLRLQAENTALQKKNVAALQERYGQPEAGGEGHVDGQRILEKGSAAIKDLKRQLHLARKRADKLQERLQDILTNSKNRSGLEELVLSEMNSPSRTQTGDSSSVSSFSYQEIVREKESSTIPARSLSSSPQAQPPRPAELSDEEVAELFQRLAETQPEKWMLEEKVKHLEVSSASMAEDLCRKSAIIETYVMDSRIDVSVAAGHTDSSRLGSVLRDLVRPGDKNLREMNKKLQNMLDEQLTKNMQLHKDMEVLSQFYPNCAAQQGVPGVS
ncbi:GRIP1-associated protein 1 [Myotis davidii]|uniref:GRIP1-associated protein 1 n=1 Tax=Myotis davidii TaxID=225400 RepID=L5LNJ8_MYODS|nr:GRIP1-associated protein 1 [Myotis davidii]